VIVITLLAWVERLTHQIGEDGGRRRRDIDRGAPREDDQTLAAGPALAGRISVAAEETASATDAGTAAATAAGAVRGVPRQQFGTGGPTAPPAPPLPPP